MSAKVQLQFVKRTWTKKPKTAEDKITNTTTHIHMHERQIGSGYVETDPQGNATYDYTPRKTANITVKTIVNEAGKNVISLGGYLWSAYQYASWRQRLLQRDPSDQVMPAYKKSYRPVRNGNRVVRLTRAISALVVSTELIP